MDMNDPDWTLEPYYLNVRRVASLAGSGVVAAALGAVVGRGFATKAQEVIDLMAMRDVFEAWLRKNATVIEPFEMLLLQNRIAPGLVFSVHNDFYFKNIRVMRRRGEPQMHANFEFDRKMVLRLRVHRDHVATGSPGDLLSGHVHELFVVAVAIEVSPNEVVAVPVFVGIRVRRGQQLFGSLPSSTCEVHPGSIDAFAQIAGEDMPTRAQLRVLKSIPEAHIKDAVAELIREPMVPKDWGGERSDLFSSQVTVDGQRVSTAFLFKGPGGGFQPMTFKHLGKNGDQIDRLYSEPADLLVLQHCHEVRAAVRGTMRAYANQMGNPRRCCIIDGYDTLKILRAYGKCGQSSVPKAEQTAPWSP
jgi:hypothetical protein